MQTGVHRSPQPALYNLPRFRRFAAKEATLAGWGTGSFENDDAAAWVANLKMLAPGELTKILLHAADDPDYLEAPAARVAVAAAEVVAALNGSPPESAPSPFSEWTRQNPQALTPELKAVAIRALDRVRRNSELKDLWLEADGLNDWTVAVRDLQARLE